MVVPGTVLNTSPSFPTYSITPGPGRNRSRVPGLVLLPSGIVSVTTPSGPVSTESTFQFPTPSDSIRSPALISDGATGRISSARLPVTTGFANALTPPRVELFTNSSKSPQGSLRAKLDAYENESGSSNQPRSPAIATGRPRSHRLRASRLSIFSVGYRVRPSRSSKAAVMAPLSQGEISPRAYMSYWSLGDNSPETNRATSASSRACFSARKSWCSSGVSPISSLPRMSKSSMSSRMWLPTTNRSTSRMSANGPNLRPSEVKIHLAVSSAAGSRTPGRLRDPDRCGVSSAG